MTDADGAQARAEASRRRIAVGVVAGALVLVLLATGVATRNVWVPVAMAAIVAASTAIALASRRSDAVRKQAAFVADFGGSLDAVRAALDVLRIRAIRAESGELQAVRAVRRQVPQLTLAQAVEVVRSL